MNRSGLAAAGLLALGLLQMTGELLDLSTLKGLGAATCASPAPKVFSAVQGLETFSSRFFVEYVDSSGKMQSIALTPSLYTRIRGHYNRRNARRAVGQHKEAAQDYDKAIDIQTKLVENEGRSELGNDLAKSYNNRGNVRGDLEQHKGAIGK